MELRTEIEFELPVGYIDAAGAVHRVGRMRMARALDEIQSLGDPRVQANEAYLPVVLLGRVLTRLGDIAPVTPEVVEGLFAADLAFLEDLYQRLNWPRPLILGAVCPRCSTEFQLQVAPLAAL